MITVNELYHHIRKNGITKARTEEDLIGGYGQILVPRGTILYFGINKSYISSYDNKTDDKNRQFIYNFNYSWREAWHIKNIIFTIIEEENKMTKTKNIVLECNSAEELEQALNKVNETEKVFATQTHIKTYNTIDEDGKEFQALLYIAVLFIRCD